MARLISPYRLGTGDRDAGEPLKSDLDLASLLGIADLDRLDLDRHVAAAHAPRDRLRVPIGVDADGTPVELDIKESAQGGMGPHGMLIGATGSGKSELLRTLVLALAVTHSSETLNFVLVDFKGGATFLGLDELPHTSAVITNLADEVALVDRMQDALHGELIRRQELLRAGRRLQLGAGLREGPRGRARRSTPLPTPVRRRRRVQRAAGHAPRVHRPVRDDRPAGPQSSACTCCWPPSGSTRAGIAPAGVPPVVPDRPAHVLRHGEPQR